MAVIDGSRRAATVRAATNKNSKLRIFQIGVNGIGNLQRKGLEGHPMVEFAGFCDVDQTAFAKVAKGYEGAWQVSDYREAFANRVDQFDAVIVDTPDFHHCPMMVTALKHGKHVFGQKPLVQQLDELRIIREALKARPGLYTQMGNQRACTTGRMQAVELLKSGRFGRPVEAQEAERIGLVAAVTEPEQLLPRALACARQILANSPYSTLHTKRVMWNNLDAPGLEAALDLENHVQVLALMTEDFGEAALAFSQKRAPLWQGR
jgi:hypothetical protein